MTPFLSSEHYITINTRMQNDDYIVDVAGEIIGNSAENLIRLIDEVFLKTQSLRLMLDLRKVTYINSYSFGIIAHLWRVIRESGRKLFILVNSSLHNKFDGFGFNDKMDWAVIDPQSAS